jgi:hypothetical protein
VTLEELLSECLHRLHACARVGASLWQWLQVGAGCSAGCIGNGNRGAACMHVFLGLLVVYSWRIVHACFCTAPAIR